MELIPIRKSRVLKQKKLAHLKAQLLGRLNENLASLSHSDKPKKLRKAERLYIKSDSLGEIVLPTLQEDERLLYSVIPGEGESIDAAVAAALAQLRDEVASGKLDTALLEGPTALTDGRPSPRVPETSSDVPLGSRACSADT